MSFIRQIFAIVVTNLRTIPLRPGSSLVIVISMAGVVGVLIPVLAMSLAFRATIIGDARADRAIVLTRIAVTEEGASRISRESFGAAALSQFEGLAIGESIRLQHGDWTIVGTFSLRAIGFSALAVAVAMLMEALLLAAIGVGLSYALFDGTTMSTLGGALSGSQVVFSLSLTPQLMIGVAAVACALGLAGGIVPGISVARSDIAAGIQEN